VAVYRLSDYARGTVEEAVGKNGNQVGQVKRRVLLRKDGKLIRLPRRRRIGKLGPAKVLEFRREA
jgi:hypothetical protein